MKYQKCFVIILCIAIIFSFSVNASAGTADYFYPKLAVIVGINAISETECIIYCEDTDGEIWNFFDEEFFWKVGDVVNLLIYRLDDNIKHDEIMDVIKEGHIDNLNLFYEIGGE